MIELPIKAISPYIEALPYVDRYGGLSTKASRYNELEGIKRKEVFPIEPTITALDCWTKGKYKDLVPNSMVKSIFYWEASDDMQLIDDGNTSNKYFVFQGGARIVFWLNLAKMGKQATNCLQTSGQYTISPFIQADLIKTLQGKPNFRINDDQLAGFVSVAVHDADIVKKDLSIFSAYTYGSDIEQLLYYPFDYGAIDFRFTLKMAKKCLAAIILENPINCINE